MNGILSTDENCYDYGRHKNSAGIIVVRTVDRCAYIWLWKSSLFCGDYLWRGGGEAPGAFKEQKWAEGGYKMSRR
jgi:hypothetical protein